MITREKVVEAVSNIWESYGDMIGRHTMEAFIYNALFTLEWKGKIDVDEAFESIHLILDEEVRAGRMFFIPRGRQVGYYRTKELMQKAQEKKKETILPPPAIPNLGGDLNALMHGLAIGYGLLPVEPPSAGTFKECLPGYLDKHKATEAVNDHICPSCGNDRVSKTEKSCWKCGSSL